MTLSLRIESVDYLDDGGPVSVTLTAARLQVGRGSAMDWTLPDAQRHLSTHHFDVVFRDGAHWLEDVSTNGTFLLGQRYRLEGPHRLRAGDRFQVGPYIIAVVESGGQQRPGTAAPAGGTTPAPAAAPPAARGWSGDDDPWSVGGPLDPVDPMPPRRAGRREDFADEFIAPPIFAAPRPSQPPSAPPPDPYPPEQFPPDPYPPAPFPPEPPHADPSRVPQPAPEPPFPGPPPALSAAPRPDPAALPPPQQSPQQPPAPHAAPPPDLPPPPAAEATPAPGPAREPSASAIVAAFCEGAGLDPQAYGDADPLALVREAGAALRGMSEQTMQHLRARAAFRQALRGQIDRTMAGIAGNPLKTAPHPSRALEEVFFRPRAGAAKGAKAMEGAARDLAVHHAALIAALQPALGAMLHDLAPEAVEAAAGGGLLGGGRKGKAWDTFVARWDAKAAAHENGMLDAFFEQLAKAYADAVRVMDE